jgi:pSer/pThr/pTyr-binding forkhead associated (FHA) protein
VAELILEVVEGPGAGTKVPLGEAIEIGREPGVALVVADDLVSRRHARVAPVTGGAIVEDLGSLNGTFVNGNEVHAPTLVSPGDHLTIGVADIEVRSAEQVAARPSAVRAVPPALRTPERQPDYVPADLAPSRPEVDANVVRLLDVHTKSKARTAPIAIFVLVVIVVLIYLAAG